MRVVLVAPFFVDGTRYRRGNPPSQPVEMPDHLRDKLPATARVLADDEVVEAPLDRAPTTLNEMGRVRFGGATLAEHLMRNVPKKPEPKVEAKVEIEPEVETGPAIADMDVRHKGGGYYEMPDGTRVHGKEKALAVLANFTTE